jgi:hypothetical protein
VWAQLARWGVRAGLELVRALMRELGLVACQPRPWRPATTQQGQAGPIPDLVNRDFTASLPVKAADRRNRTASSARNTGPCAKQSLDVPAGGLRAREWEPNKSWKVTSSRGGCAAGSG